MKVIFFFFFFFSVSVLKYHRNSWNVKKNINPKHSDAMFKKVIFIPSQKVIHHDEKTELCRYMTNDRRQSIGALFWGLFWRKNHLVWVLRRTLYAIDPLFFQEWHLIFFSYLILFFQINFGAYPEFLFLSSIPCKN